ncbi:MAG: hypothetical protein V3U78_05475 [Thiotrichaceae bacterium]
MRYVYKWWAEYEEYGDVIKEEIYFSSQAKMEKHYIDHHALNGWDSSYMSGHVKIEVH